MRDLLAGCDRSGNDVVLPDSNQTTGTLVVGAPGSGKTTFLSVLSMQVIRQVQSGNAAMLLLDGMGGLFRQVAGYCQVRGVPATVLDPATDRIAAFQPLKKNGGMVAAQADHLVTAVMKLWGGDHDRTPTLEKNLRALLTALIVRGHTIADALPILRTPQLRAKFVAELPTSEASATLAELLALSPRDYHLETMSLRNRLARVAADTALGRILGTGLDHISIPHLMRDGGILLANLGQSINFTEADQRLLGALLVNEIYTAGMALTPRIPVYVVIDEAGLFAAGLPEIGAALDHLRQKNVRLILSCQHLGQFEDDRVRLSVKNSCRTKVAFAVEDRESALELAGDLLPGLASPRLKDEMRGIAYRLKDVYLPTLRESRSRSTADGWNASCGGGSGRGASFVEGELQTTAFVSGTSERPGPHGTESCDIVTVADGDGWSRQRGISRSKFKDWRKGEQHLRTDGQSLDIGLVPATLHEQYEEVRGRQFFSLPENQWMAADDFLVRGVGSFVLKQPGLGTTIAQGLIPTRDFSPLASSLESEGIPAAEADRLIAERQARLLELPASAPSSAHPRRSKP